MLPYCSHETARERGTHFDHALALYDPTKHRALATRFGQDIRVSTLCYRALAVSILGYYQAARADSERAIREAREIGQAAELMHALLLTIFIHIWRGDFPAAIAQADELFALAKSKNTAFRKAGGAVVRGLAIAQISDRAEEAAQMLSSGLSGVSLTGTISSVLPIVFD